MSTATRTPTAPLPAPAAAALRRLELAFASPVERLRIQIARLEHSLQIQRDGLACDIAVMRNVALASLERAEAEGSFRVTVGEIADLRRQISGLRRELAIVVRFEAASAHCRQLAGSADYDGCLEAQDEMAMCRCQLAAAGRLDLIGVSA